jgi:hypothetical protein
MKSRICILVVIASIALGATAALAGILLEFRQCEVRASVLDVEANEWDFENIPTLELGFVDLEAQAAFESDALSRLQSGIQFDANSLSLTGQMFTSLRRNTPGVVETVEGTYRVECVFSVTEPGDYSFELIDVTPVEGQRVFLRRIDAPNGDDVFVIDEPVEMGLYGSLDPGLYRLLVHGHHIVPDYQQPFWELSGLHFIFRVSSGVVSTEAMSLSKIRALF